MGTHLVKEGYNDFMAQHYAQWQVAAFRLPAALLEASGWWDAPPWLRGLWPKDFMPITNASSPKDFLVVMQERTLVLAWALQTCAKGLGPQQEFSVTLHENFKNAWSLDDPHYG